MKSDVQYEKRPISRVSFSGMRPQNSACLALPRTFASGRIAAWAPGQPAQIDVVVSSSFGVGAGKKSDYEAPIRIKSVFAIVDTLQAKS